MEILSLGEKIKRRRKELNMTLKDLAGDRITPGQISLVESGRSNPSMDLLEYLAGALNTSVEYLMESEETQAAAPTPGQNPTGKPLDLKNRGNTSRKN